MSDAFGRRLREWRDRTRPEEIGLPAGIRRKVPGLRREELAAFADLSVDYLTRLEQGSARNPSPAVIAALGRALRLPRLEIDLLYRLAGQVSPSDLEVPTHLTPGTQRLIDRLGEVPVAAFDATWTLMSANAPWQRLRGAGPSRAGHNLIREVFTAPVDGDLEYRDRLRRSLVADLRLSAGRYPADRRLQALLREMLAENAAFAATWADARAHPFTAEPKLVVHPDFGDLWLDCDVMTATDGDTRLVLYTAAKGSEAERALLAMARGGVGSET